MWFSPPAVTTRLQSLPRSANQDTEAGVQGGIPHSPEPRSSGRAPRPQPLPVPTLTGLLPRHSEKPKYFKAGSPLSRQPFQGDGGTPLRDTGGYRETSLYFGQHNMFSFPFAQEKRRWRQMLERVSMLRALVPMLGCRRSV